MKCASCGTDVSPGATVCGSCGRPMRSLLSYVPFFGVVGGIVGSLIGFTLSDAVGALIGGLIGIIVAEAGARMLLRPHGSAS
jgi:hypothetical protein